MKTDLVVAGYIYSDNKLLLVHHKKLNLWLPVGGHIEKDETPDEALHREVLEETGMKVEILGKNRSKLVGTVKKNLAIPFNVNVHSAGDHDHCCFFYVCRAIDPGKISLNDEAHGFRWVSEEDLYLDDIPDDVKDMAKAGFEIIRS